MFVRNPELHPGQVRSRSGVVEQRRGQVTPGKRKRSAREKSVESGEVWIKQIKF